MTGGGGAIFGREVISPPSLDECLSLLLLVGVFLDVSGGGGGGGVVDEE
jgi:hypothetical protein